MKISTLNKYLKILTDIKASGKTIYAYCKENELDNHQIYKVVNEIKRDATERSETACNIISLYDEISNPINENQIVEVIDNDEKSEISYIRDDEGKITYYQYSIFKKNKSPLSGKLTREEMATIYRLYSYYGDSLTRRTISRHFPDLSLVDFKRILRAFNIYKDSSPFPPHMIEELSIDELRDIQSREKENSFLRKAEEDAIKNNERLLKKYAQENIELKKQLNNINTLSFDYQTIDPIIIKTGETTGQSINLYLADMHLGSMCMSNSIYSENINYGFEEAKRRLEVILHKLEELGYYDTFNLVLMGDQVDCCGIFGKTNSLTHDMPENMQPRDQANAYINLIMWFIDSLVKNEVANKYNVYSVPCGNHSGNFEYMCNKTIMALINAKYPEIETTLWEKYYGVFTQNDQTFVCCHGKPEQFAKKGMPLNLDDKTKVLLYEWLDSQGIYGTNIHIVKGDLHSNNLNSCNRFTYRNVLSLYGASDYSNINYSRNAYGISYDLLVKDNVISGTFENV